MEQHRASPFSIFLVEDAPMLRARLEVMVGDIAGAHHSGHAAGAQEAIDAILRLQPDAVVLDIHLAQGNGFDVMRAVQAQAPHIAFYVLTNYPDERYRRRALEFGARGFYDKTTEFEHLRAALAAAAQQ